MWGCYYGIAMKDNELIARKLDGQIDIIKNELEADSLAYLELKSILSLTGNANGFCTACFDGNYPVSISGEESNQLLTL